MVVISTKVVIPDNVDYRDTLNRLLSKLFPWGLGTTGGPGGVQVIVVLETGGRLAQVTLEQRRQLLEELPLVQLVDSWAQDSYYRP